MPNALVPASIGKSLANVTSATVTARDRLEEWLKAKSPHTQRAYVRDLEMFARHIGIEAEGFAAAGLAMQRMCDLDSLGHVNERGQSMSERAVALLILEGWRDAQLAEGLSSATINRRLSAVNSALRAIHKADLGPGRVDVELVKSEARTDVKGPGVVRVSRALDDLAKADDQLGRRNFAIVLLAAQRGLRRSEIAGLSVEDVNLAECRLKVLRKGKREKAGIAISAACRDAIADWLEVRQADPGGALFASLSNRASGQRITTQTVYNVIRAAGSASGFDGWSPHKLRHTAITEALRLSNGSLPTAQAFAGHASSTTTSRYIDDKARLEQQAVDAMGGAFEFSKPRRGDGRDEKDDV